MGITNGKVAPPVYPNWISEDLTYLTTAVPTEKRPLISQDNSIVATNFIGPYCQLGLWENGMGNGNSWLGWPLGRPDPENTTVYWDNLRDNKNELSNQCTNLWELSDGLAGGLSSMKLSGYCECDFFAAPACAKESVQFTAYNQENGALWKNTPFDNLIQSIQCRYSESFWGIDGFGVVMIDLVTKRNPPAEGVSQQATWSPGYYKSSDSRKCIQVDHKDAASGNFRVTDLSVIHATCHFYLDPDCGEAPGLDRNKPFLSLASAGMIDWVDPDAGEELGKAIRSFKCFPPFNIASDDAKTKDVIKNLDKEV